MSERAITTKCLPSPSTTLQEVARGDRNLARCMQRRIHMYTQLPVRCQRSSPYYRPPRTILKLSGLTTMNRSPIITSAKSSPDSSRCGSILKALGTPRKKSVSMIDLSPSSTDCEGTDLRSESNSTLEHLDDTTDKTIEAWGSEGRARAWLDAIALSDFSEAGSRFSQNPKKAASLICHVLMLNAWRQRRADVEQLRENTEKLSLQVDHLHLQIIVLRKLLETENNRVAKCTAEIHMVRSQLDDALRERDAVRTEREKAEDEVRRLNELSGERLVMVENLRNELDTAQSQLRAVDDQISKDREKLLKLREDKRLLLDKISSSEAVVIERGLRIAKSESMIEDLQVKLATQIALVDSSQEQLQRYSNELKEKLEEKVGLGKRILALEESEKSLQFRTVTLEVQLSERESSLRRLEAAYSSQALELNELRERLIQQSQEVGWSSRMLQIAGSVVRAPRVILRTLSLLSPRGSLSP